MAKDSIDDLEVKTEEKEKAKLPNPFPTVNRSVHYYADEYPKPFAAIITEVSEEVAGNVGLVIFDPRGDTRYRMNVPWSDEPKANHWNYPPKKGGKKEE